MEQLYEVNGDTNQALIEAETAAHINMNDPVAHYILGVALAANKRFDAAKTSLEKALQLAPEYEEARKYLRRLQDFPADVQ